MFFTLLGIAVLNAAIGYGVGYCVGAFVDEFFLTDAIEEAYPDAFKILIKEKKKNAVNVGIFDIDDMTIEPSVEIESEQGVSDELYVGQVIYI
jgi:hypothetical protein